MSEKRRIKFNGEDLGEIAFQKLYRMRMRGDIDHTAEFLSAKTNCWLPLAGILEDLDTSITNDERVRQIKECGIMTVSLLGSGSDGDCPICKALVKKYPVDGVPTIPPENCSCNPWCALTVIAEAAD